MILAFKHGTNISDVNAPHYQRRRDQIGPDHEPALRSASGQTEKNSVRAYVFRFTPELGHCLIQSARVKRVNKRHARSRLMPSDHFSSMIGRRNCAGSWLSVDDLPHLSAFRSLDVDQSQRLTFKTVRDQLVRAARDLNASTAAIRFHAAGHVELAG